MSALEQARHDIELGDLGSARRRLASRLSTSDFDPEVLAMLGDVCALMGDPIEAGRYWLMSNREGEDVRTGVEMFVSSSRHDAGRIVRALPHAAVMIPPPQLAGPALDRIEELQLWDALQERRERGGVSEESRAPSRLDRLVPMGCVLFVGLVVILAVVGAVAVVRWIAGWWP
jgi:hypothetical protein